VCGDSIFILTGPSWSDFFHTKHVSSLAISLLLSAWHQKPSWWLSNCAKM